MSVVFRRDKELWVNGRVEDGKRRKRRTLSPEEHAEAEAAARHMGDDRDALLDPWPANFPHYTVEVRGERVQRSTSEQEPMQPVGVRELYAEFRACAELSLLEKHVLALILEETDWPTAMHFWGREHVCDRAGVTPRTYRRLMVRFEALGLLERVKIHRLDGRLRRKHPAWQLGLQFRAWRVRDGASFRNALNDALAPCGDRPSGVIPAAACTGTESALGGDTRVRGGGDTRIPSTADTPIPSTADCGVPPSISGKIASQGSNSRSERGSPPVARNGATVATGDQDSRDDATATSPPPELDDSAASRPATQDREAREGARAQSGPTSPPALADAEASPERLRPRRSAHGLVEWFYDGIGSVCGAAPSLPFGLPLQGLGDAIDRRIGRSEGQPTKAARDLGARWARYCDGAPKSPLKAIDWLGEGAPEHRAAFGVPKQRNPEGAPWLDENHGLVPSTEPRSWK